MKMKPVSLSLIVFYLVALEKRVHGARILGIFPLDAKSHFMMFEEVMKALADTGHQVDVVSHFPRKEPYPNYTDISWSKLSPMSVDIGMTYDFVHSVQSTANVMIDMGGNNLCKLLEISQLKNLINNPPKDPPYDLIIAESFFGSCWYAFGRHLNVPLVGLSSTSIQLHANEPIGNPLNTAFVFAITDGSSIYMDFWHRFKNTIFTLLEIVKFNYYSEVQSDIVKKHFGPEMPGVRELERDVALLLVNSHHTLTGVRPFTPAVVEVGGIHIQDDNTKMSPDLTKWLDESTDGFIYFSFGSMIKIESFPKTTLKELYSGLARIAPIRVLMRVLVPAELPPGLPENVSTLRWVPQIQVLKHKNIRGFVTHGGLLGVLEALNFGVPLIGIPIFADQPINIKNCVDRGIAVFLDYKHFTEDKFVTAVNTIVHDPKYKNNMNRLSQQFRDRPLSARNTAVFWIEYILKYGSDALKSPAMKLSWWQTALLDVYGSIIITVLIIFHLIKLLIRTLFRRILFAKKAVPTLKKTN